MNHKNLSKLIVSTAGGSEAMGQTNRQLGEKGREFGEM